MADYTVVNGNITMMIRDTGSVVEFWVITDQWTFNHDQTWSYVANGASSGIRTVDMNNRGSWQKFGGVTVTTDQNVSFTIYDAGLGFNTYTFTHFIDRASAPAAPKPPVLTVRSSTTIELDLGADGANNGAAIDSRQYSGSPSSGGVGSNARNAVSNYQWSGLIPGTKYYFWERTHNAKGYSPWSAVATATTWRVPDAPATPVVTLIKDTLKVLVEVKYGGNGGTAFLEHQVGYALDSTAPTMFATATGTVPKATLVLEPGVPYYIWTRSRNAVGWSPWSPMKSYKMPAGARVKVGSVYKDAVPYVNVAGVWKIARSWGKATGVWKETA